MRSVIVVLLLLFSNDSTKCGYWKKIGTDTSFHTALLRVYHSAKYPSAVTLTVK